MNRLYPWMWLWLFLAIPLPACSGGLETPLDAAESPSATDASNAADAAEVTDAAPDAAEVTDAAPDAAEVTDAAPDAAEVTDAAPDTTGAAITPASASNAFGFDLYERLRRQPGNLVISPMSITTALTMTWGGARGVTAEQMRRVMYLSDSPAEVMTTTGRLAKALTRPSRPSTFRIANRLFGERTYDFEPAYLQRVASAFGAPLAPMNFRGAPDSARAEINQWVEGETERRIRDLLPPGSIDGETRLVLVNAIYFLGDWLYPFKKKDTRPRTFHLDSSNEKKVPTMYRNGHYHFMAQDGISALKILYEGGDFSMLFVLPDDLEGLDAVESSLSDEKLRAWVSALTFDRVRVSIPKFEIRPERSLSLAEPLTAMGMRAAFDRSKADFTGIADPPNPDDRLFIDKVFHKGFLRVDEKGTEAAAATAVEMARVGSSFRDLRVFHADHPFLFFLVENRTSLILFMGRVTDPSVR